jgi:hypothetical protein
MISEDVRKSATRSITRAEKTVEEALIAVREATRAMEAEAAALVEIEKAYKKANDAAAELKSAVRANKAAALRIEKARNMASHALKDATKAAQIEAVADKDEEQKVSRRKDEEARVEDAESKGKLFNVDARNEARRKAKESEDRAVIAHRNARRAKEALAAADREVKEAEQELTLTSTRVSIAKEADTTARTEVPRAESIARRNVKIAKTALDAEAGAKKVMDSMVSRLKGLMDNEGKIAQLEASRLRASDEGVINKAERTNQAIDTSELSSDIYSGTLKLLIAGHVDHSMIQRFQKRLESVEGFRIKSVYGSGGEGIDITLLAEQPVSIVGRLNEIELVQRVSRISRREFEVELKSA